MRSNSCSLVIGKHHRHVLASKRATEARQKANSLSGNTFYTNSSKRFKSTAHDWMWFVCILVFGGHLAGLYSPSGPPHPSRPLQWPRSPPFPSWQAGRAAARTAPVCPSARRSWAHTPWRAPGPLWASAAPCSASSPAAWLCRSPRTLSGPEPCRRGGSSRLQGCSLTPAQVAAAE